jgi:hypothetical protein
MPEVTVIIAAYNSSPTLKCALRSLQRQTFQDFEAWAVGDGCTDDSERIVAGFEDSRFHWFNLPRHFGSQSWPNNEGLRRAAGSYIAYLGQDDLWFPWHLAALLAALKQSGVDFTHAVAALVGPSGPVGALGAPGVKRSYAHRFVAPSTWLHRREMVEACGSWPDPDGQIGGVDFAFQRRAFLAGKHFACSSQISVIKFPSPWWRTYALRTGHPQLEYITAMEADPTQLERNLLAELVLESTRQDENQLLLRSVKAVYRAMAGSLEEWYGPERWPLSWYLRFKHKRWRKKVCILRGLGPFADSR